MCLKEIEGNPSSVEDVALVEMCEREAWSHEGRRARRLALAAPFPTD
jgi:hypothetical protein